MSDTAVQEAIERWAQSGLIPEELAQTLRDEVASSAALRSRRTAQYVIAITAGLVLLTASALFIERSWPLLPTAVRTIILWIIGAGLIAGGISIEPRFRLRPVSYLLQTSGLLMLLFSYAHSDQTWPQATMGGILAGVLALATPITSAVLAIPRNNIMPAVNAALGYTFIAFFLDRVGIHEDLVVWILDGVLLATMTVLVVRLRRAPPGATYTPTLLYSLIASLMTGLILAGLTAAGPLRAGDSTIYALDMWLLVIIGSTLWAIHAAPVWLRRPWYSDILAVSVLVAAAFAFATLSVLGVARDWQSIGGAGVGACGLFYGVRTGTAPVLLTGSLSVVASVWHFGIMQAGSLGAVGALAVTAALLFWVSSHLGKNMEVG